MSLKWLPNAVTLVRIAAAPLVGWLLWQVPNAQGAEQIYPLASLAFILFTLASITDWLDGFLARALNATSDLGAKLDLWADKIIVASVLLGALNLAPLAALAGLVSLTVRDLYIMRLRARRPDVNLKATFLAKSKTAIVMAGMALVLAGMALAHSGWGVAGALWIGGLGGVLFASGCVLSLYTGYQYVRAAQMTKT